jgi:hypothetical protein
LLFFPWGLMRSKLLILLVPSVGIEPTRPLRGPGF